MVYIDITRIRPPIIIYFLRYLNFAAPAAAAAAVAGVENKRRLIFGRAAMGPHFGIKRLRL